MVQHVQARRKAQQKKSLPQTVWDKNPKFLTRVMPKFKVWKNGKTNQRSRNVWCKKHGWQKRPKIEKTTKPIKNKDVDKNIRKSRPNWASSTFESMIFGVLDFVPTLASALCSPLVKFETTVFVWILATRFPALAVSKFLWWFTCGGYVYCHDFWPTNGE